MSKPNSAKCNHTPKTPLLLNRKPFCDCKHCECTDCPDILKLLSINVTDTTRRFNPKVCPKRGKDNDPKPPQSKESQELLNVLTQIKNDPCSCTTIARGVRDNVHMNLGLTKRREQIIIKSNESPQTETKTNKATKAVPLIHEPSTPERAASEASNQAGNNKCRGQCKCCKMCAKK